MTAHSSEISAFKAPPIEELVIGVQFPPITNFHDAYGGLYWQRVKEEFPKISSQPRIEGPIESLAPPQPLRIEFPITGQPQSRTWLLGKNDEYLIQIQNTRFIVNWRKRQEPYPKFARLRDMFLSHYESFLGLLGEVGLESPRVQQVEVSYINWITDLPAQAFFGPAGATKVMIEGSEVSPEDQNWSARYLIGDDPSVVKRLYAQLQWAIRITNHELSSLEQVNLSPENSQQGYQLGLTFKAARSAGLDRPEIISLIDQARSVSVPVFTDLTTPAAHTTWERYK